MATTNKDWRILPKGGHEIQCVLNIQNQSLYGDFSYNVTRPPRVMIFLGTKETSSLPAGLGFRVLVRNTKTISEAAGILEDLYHIESYRYRPNIGDVKFFANIPASFTANVFSASHDLPKHSHCLAFKNCRNAFQVSTEDYTRISEGQAQTALRDLADFPRFDTVNILFAAKPGLAQLIEQAIQNNGVGVSARLESASQQPLPLPMWPGDVQTRMVAGSTALINALKKAKGEPQLVDAAETALMHRPKAVRFNTALASIFPSLSHASNANFRPIMLATKGLCHELPLGGSMLNVQNVLTTMALLISMGSQGIPLEAFGVVTFYQSQVDVYYDIIADFHQRQPTNGFDKVKVGTVESWSDKEVSFTIVDLVRTSCARGIMHDLIDTQRLSIALTVHQDGLIIVGDRTCSSDAKQRIIGLQLEAIFACLEGLGCVIPVDKQDESMLDTLLDKTVVSGTAEMGLTEFFHGSSQTNTPHGFDTGSFGTTPVMTSRLYRGIPELDALNVRRKSKSRPEQSPSHFQMPLGTPIEPRADRMRKKSTPVSPSIQHGVTNTTSFKGRGRRRAYGPGNAENEDDDVEMGEIVQPVLQNKSTQYPLIIRSTKALPSADNQKHVKASEDDVEMGEIVQRPLQKERNQNPLVLRSSNATASPDRLIKATQREIHTLSGAMKIMKAGPHNLSKQKHAAISMPIASTKENQSIKATKTKQEPEEMIIDEVKKFLPAAVIRTSLQARPFGEQHVKRYKKINGIFAEDQSWRSSLVEPEVQKLFSILGESLQAKDTAKFDATFGQLWTLAGTLALED